MIADASDSFKTPPDPFIESPIFIEDINVIEKLHKDSHEL